MTVSPGPTIADLCARFQLPDAAEAQLEQLARIVAVDQGAPTLHEPRRIIDDHLADSLVALELDHVPWGAGTIADLGSGAGFPGLPLAIALPATRVVLVESNARKCDFLGATVERLGLPNVAIQRARAEQWHAGSGACDVVVVRALAALAVVAEYAAPLLRIGGALVAWRGRRDQPEETMGAIAAAELGLEPLSVVSVAPYPEALHRHLHVLMKVSPTPDRFPRRPGMARKHPLGRAV